MRSRSLFLGPTILAGIGLASSLWLGYAYTGTASGALSTFLICAVLSVLEVSLSFDNAVVNASVLRRMSPIWQRRFLTWGIVIAVFGMRIVFPLAIVSVAAHVGPLEAVRIAVSSPETYSGMMKDAELGIAAFGGTFLMMVALRFFFDHAKEVHWLGPLECRLSRAGRFRAIEVAVAAAIVLFIAMPLDDARGTVFVEAAAAGLLTFVAVTWLGKFLDSPRLGSAARVGLGAFLYLEVLDASFSFDSVVGAFALSSNLFVIAIGLGIGAIYIRSLTMLMVEKQTLAEYRYLEHGAFYAIFALAAIMFVRVHFEVPELVTGLIGAGFILASFLSSIKANRIHGKLYVRADEGEEA